MERATSCRARLKPGATDADLFEVIFAWSVSCECRAVGLGGRSDAGVVKCEQGDGLIRLPVWGRVYVVKKAEMVLASCETVSALIRSAAWSFRSAAQVSRMS